MAKLRKRKLPKKQPTKQINANLKITLRRHHSEKELETIFEDSKEKHRQKHPKTTKRQYAPFPSHLNRVQPFFPYPRYQRPEKIDKPITVHSDSWGDISIVEGYKLPIRDKGLCMAISLLASQQGRLVRVTHQKLCTIMGIASRRDQIAANQAGLRRLMSMVIECDTLLNNLQFGILSWVNYEKDTNVLYIKVNEKWLQLILGKYVTYAELPYRQKIKTDYAKLVYDFLQSQNPFLEWSEYLIRAEKMWRVANYTVEGRKPGEIRKDWDRILDSLKGKLRNPRDDWEPYLSNKSKLVRKKDFRNDLFMLYPHKRVREHRKFRKWARQLELKKIPTGKLNELKDAVWRAIRKRQDGGDGDWSKAHPEMMEFYYEYDSDSG